MSKRTVFVNYVSLLILLTCLSRLGLAALPDLNDDERIPSLAPMLDRVTPAVVNIATEWRVTVQQNPLFSDPFFRRFFNAPNGPIQRRTQSLGSGVIVDAKRGLVLTNSHVIANAVQITVTLRDGRQLDAEIVGTDPETDIAVIKILADNLTDIKPTDSDKLRVGDYVVAIGNPFGLGQTVTSGIVSALSRSGLGIEGYEDFIQTDASINPGNSGGALVNLRGELVGINTAILSQDGSNIGIGFAIPANLSLNIMEQLIDKGEVQRGFIGISVQDLDMELAEALGVKNQKGAIITNVIKFSPAAEAGLLPGDVIISINNKSVKRASDVRNHIGLLQVEDKVVFDLIRNGERRKLTARVTSANKLIGVSITNQRLDGINFTDIDPGSPYFGRVEGVVVSEIEQGSLGWRSGLRKADVISSINRTPVINARDFLNIVNNIKGSLLLRVIRGESVAFLVLR